MDISPGPENAVSPIIWINGPFGGGKTQTAHELHRRLPGSIVCDPELLGLALQRTLPGDFQDLALWRDATRRTLAEAAHLQGVMQVIVPMTIVVPEYFREIVEGLREEGFVVHHFALLAPRNVVLRRLHSRLDLRNSWPARQLDRCLAALADPLFAEHLQTDGRSIQQVAEDIASHCDLILQPSSVGPLRQRLRRLGVQARHFRFGGQIRRYVKRT
jgi:hypothetical protein